MNNFERTIGLIGEDNFRKLASKTILIVGLGGVGGTAIECLARTGISNFVICDFDIVNESNLNRQILYSLNSINKLKTEEAASRLKTINKDVKIHIINEKFSKEIYKQLSFRKIDYIVDAIDDINGKIDLIKYAIDKNINFISSLGMANRFDPSLVKICKLNQTKNDPLARKLRYLLKNEGVDLAKVNVCWSSEIPFKHGNRLNSIMAVPSSAGLNIAFKIIKDLTEEQ